MKRNELRKGMRVKCFNPNDSEGVFYGTVAEDNHDNKAVVRVKVDSLVWGISIAYIKEAYVNKSWRKIEWEYPPIGADL